MSSITIAPLKILFLAAGYGTRLQKDIIADKTRVYHHLLGKAKALLPLAGLALIDHWLNLLSRALPHFSAANSTFIVCNDFTYPQFCSWASTHGFPESNILNDGTASNEGRLGAVADLSLAVRHFNLQSSNVLVIAGDTLFMKDFDLTQFLEAALEVKGSLVTSYIVRDEETVKTGILEVENGATSPQLHPHRVVNFLEKPNCGDTASRLACPCFYHFRPVALQLIDVFLDQKRQGGADITEIDATGKFICWLIRQHPVFATPIRGRLDIGGLVSYKEAEMYMQETM